MNQTDQSRRVAQLQATILDLEQRLLALEVERKIARDRRRWNMAAVGAGISLCIHILVMLYLSTLHRDLGPGEAAAPAIEFAILDQQELTELEEAVFDELTTEPASVDDNPIDAAELQATVPHVELAAAKIGSLSTLGGAGDGTSPMGLSGGGGGTSFFGIGAKGDRIAYIVDVSASMETDGRFGIAARELARSVGALPDYANFYITLFANGAMTPPMQQDWLRARPGAINAVMTWVRNVSPNGGTEPYTAFFQVLALDPRPDAIFFLTDGEFDEDVVRQVASMNSSGKRVKINTIAFGSTVGQNLLRAIAQQSGGIYRYVPIGGK